MFLVVFGPACKELISNKADKETKMTLLVSGKEVRSQGKQLPHTPKSDRQKGIERIMTY